MATTVTIQVTEHRTGLLAPTPAKTEIDVTRATKAQAIAEAITMLAGAHRPELACAWGDLVAQIEPLLAAYRSSIQTEATG